MKIHQILKPSKKKAIILAVIIILIIAGVNLTSGKKQTPLQFSEAKRQDIKSTVSSSGTLTGKDVVNLKFRSSGKLSYINVKAGETVSKGEIIAGLDTQDLSIKLQQARNTLKDKQAAAEKTLDDVKDHSKDETFTQKKDRTAAEVARDNAYDSVKEAKRAFQDVVLITPISGLVTQTNGIAGQTVSSADLIAQIVDTSEVMFDTDIDEADIGKISLGQQADVTLDAYEDKIFKGTVDQILPQTKTTSSGTTVVTVRIKLTDTPQTFINGLSGEATIILAEGKNALTIPQEALREDATVLIQKKGRLVPVNVTSGIYSDTEVEIKEGLNEDDKVVLNPPVNGADTRSNRNPVQSMIFRLFGGGRGGPR